jgi:hypothetical protein
MKMFFITKSYQLMAPTSEHGSFNLYSDEFKFSGFLFGPLYLIWQQLWIWAAISFVSDALLIGMALYHIFTLPSLICGLLLLHILIGLEVNNLLLSKKLSAEDIIGVVYGNKINAERSLFQSIIDQQNSKKQQPDSPVAYDNVDWLNAWKGQS